MRQSPPFAFNISSLSLPNLFRLSLLHLSDNFISLPLVSPRAFFPLSSNNQAIMLASAGQIVVAFAFFAVAQSAPRKFSLHFFIA